EGGAASIEHGDGLTNEQLQLMKDRGTFLVGTDFSFDNWYAYGMDSATASFLADKIVDRLKRAYKIGTKMAFGTDIIIDLPGMNRIQSSLKVLESWKAANIPAPYILQTMTIYAAELLGIEKQRGILEPGYAADIIAVKNNPAENIDAVKTVNFVMKDGRIIKSK
ncbi:MAG: amidohydrolase family protein, partial [Rhizobacter sp.]|nr:amidohydrolase family protein [Ferruginibacter sp.]